MAQLRNGITYDDLSTYAFTELLGSCAALPAKMLLETILSGEYEV